MFFFHITCFMCTDLWGPELESQWEKRGLLPGALAATFTSRQAAAVLLKGPVCLLPAGHTSVCKDLWMTYRLCQYATTACFVFESVLLSGDSHNQEAMLQATTGGSACVCVCYSWTMNRNVIKIAIWPTAIFKMQEWQYLIKQKSVSKYHFKLLRKHLCLVQILAKVTA